MDIFTKVIAENLKERINAILNDKPPFEMFKAFKPDVEMTTPKSKKANTSKHDFNARLLKNLIKEIGKCLEMMDKNIQHEDEEPFRKLFLESLPLLDMLKSDNDAHFHEGSNPE